MTTERAVVAIVDDDTRLLESLSDLLESAGYATRCYLSGQALLDGGIADLDMLITDIGMAGLDGFELRERVLRLRPCLPVFLITGRHEVADRAADTGGLFRKPFDARELLTAVAGALKSRDGGQHGT